MNFYNRKGATTSRLSIKIRQATGHRLSATSLLQLLVKFTTRAGNINSARNTALPILGPLHDARIFPAFRASGGFAGVHDLLSVGCLCDLRHVLLLTGMCRRPASRGSTWCFGSNSGVLTGRMGTLKERASVLANSSLHDKRANQPAVHEATESHDATAILGRRFAVA